MLPFNGLGLVGLNGRFSTRMRKKILGQAVVAGHSDGRVSCGILSTWTAGSLET